MRFSRKKSVTITDNITIPSTVLTAKEYDQSIGSMNNPATPSKSHFHDAAIAKSAHTAKLRMLAKRASKKKSKKSILKNGSSSSSSSSSSSTTKQKEEQGFKNSSNKPKVSSNSSSKASAPTTASNATAAASTMSITVNGKPILKIEPNATPEDVQTFLSTLQCGLQSKSYELEQQKKSKKIDDDEEDIQDDNLPTSTSETEVSEEEEDIEFDDILPTTTSETEASQEEDGELKLGPRATQKFEQMEKDMDAEVTMYDDKLGKSLRTLLEMKSKMQGKLLYSFVDFRGLNLS